MVQRVAWSDYVTLSPMAENVSAARGFVQDLLIDHDLLYLVEDVRLVTSELATNAARHAKTSFTVLLEGFILSLRLTVTHDCVSRPVRTAVPVMATAGRGANIVGYYSREWGVREGRRNTKSVWASFALQGHGRPRGRLSQTSTATLSSLLHDVKSARANVQVSRASGAPGGGRGGQAQLAAALGFYVEALAERHLPVPYLLRDELRLYGRAAAYNTRP